MTGSVDGVRAQDRDRCRDADRRSIGCAGRRYTPDAPPAVGRRRFTMIDDDTLRFLEFGSYLVTVIGLPVAIFALWRQARDERVNERKEIEQREEETYLRLSEQYTEFVESVLRYPELGLHPRLPPTRDLSVEEQARRLLFFEILIALFERAYILLHEDALDPQGARRWQSWADYMEQWCGREDFRAMLPDLLRGEDPAFSRYILALGERAAGPGGAHA
jgi:hypothetical protein